MKFNFSVEFMVVVFLFVSIMIISTYGSTKVSPFETTSSTLSMYPYRDGFTDYNTPDPVISGPTNVDNVTKVNQPVSVSIANVKPMDDIETPDRMQKLQWADVNSPEQKLDVFSDLPSSGNCANISCGLSNSKGYLCPTKEILNSYATRGGNASGKPAQIGA